MAFDIADAPLPLAHPGAFRAPVWTRTLSVTEGQLAAACRSREVWRTLDHYDLCSDLRLIQDLPSAGEVGNVREQIIAANPAQRSTFRAVKAPLAISS